jgi:DNA-binding response OmpR family regulator
MSNSKTENTTERRIVLAEDDAIVRRLISHVLQKEGFEVLAASDGEEALKLISSRRPDAIILDAMMPGVDGLEVLHSLRRGEETKDIPVMILSGRSLERDVVTGFDFGANDYLVKPFKPNELVVRLKRMLNPARTWEREER